MKKTLRLKTKLTIILICAFVAIILMVSIVSNIATNIQFEKYIRQKQEDNILKTVTNVGKQYYPQYNTWDIGYVHALAMQALENGYIIKVIDENKKTIWDTQAHDMEICKQMMNDVVAQMHKFDPKSEGHFTVETFDLVYEEQVYGSVEIQHYVPYFLMEEEFDYLSTLNYALIIVGLIVCMLAVVLASYLAWQISHPIKNSIDSTKEISEGNYDIHLVDSSRTKELEELSNSINTLSKTLSKQESLRKQLTADVAHELRTPLTTLSTHVEMLMLGVWEPTPKRLEDIYSEVGRLGIMVKDLEALSKNDKNSIVLSKQPTELDYIVTQCINALSDKAKEKDISVSFVSKKITATVDSNRIYQVFYNLLLNAIKYSHKNGHINIELSSDSKKAIISLKMTALGFLLEIFPFCLRGFIGQKNQETETLAAAE